MDPITVRCTIQTITIPRFLPTGIFVAWNAPHAHGQTKYFDAKSPQIIVNEHFFFLNDESQPLRLSLNARSTSGYSFQYGTIDYICSKEISKGSECCNHFEFISDIGNFYLDISLIRENDNILSRPVFDSQIEQVNATRYCELAITAKPTIDSSQQPDELWGKTGVFSKLQNISTSSDISIIEELRNLIPKLQAQKQQAFEYASFLQKSFEYLAATNYTFIDGSGKTYTIDQASEAKSPLYPSLAVVVCQGVDNYFEKQQSYDIESFLLSVASLMMSYVSSSTVEAGLIYCMSSAMFISQYLMDNYPQKFEAVILVLEMTSDKAIINFVLSINTKVGLLARYPRRFLHLISEKERFFTACNVPANVWNEVRSRLLLTMDFMASSQWVMNSDTTEIPNFKQLFPDYDWPLLTGLGLILEEADLFVLKKKKLPAEIIKPLRGNWMRIVLNRLATNDGKPYKPGQIEKILESDAKEPTLSNIDEWAHLNMALKGRSILPRPLPVISS